MGKTAKELFEESKQRVIAESAITNLSPGSVARTLLQIWSDQVGELYSFVDARIAQTFVTTATGQSLDLIGEVVGASRTESTFANGKVRVFINPDLDLVFQDILDLLNNRDGGSRTEITFPVNITVRAGDQSYVTTQAVTLTANIQEVEVEVISTLAGAVSNVEQSGIDTIIFNDPLLALLQGIVKVTNDTPIESGRDVQSDEDYRFVITNSFLSGARANETAIRLAVLSVPGVADISIENFTFGIGTFSVFVTSTSPVTTEGTLAAVQAALNEVQAKGIRGVAVSPDLLGVQSRIVLTFLPTTTTSDKTTITKQVQTNVIDYINNLRPGETLVVNEIRQRVMETSEQLHDMDLTNLIIGDFNLVTGVIDNADTTLSIANQTANLREKFVSSRNLIEVCCI